jgi:hypothetical protein
VYCSTIHNSHAIETAVMPHYTMNGLRKYGIYTLGILFSHKEE